MHDKEIPSVNSGEADAVVDSENPWQKLAEESIVGNSEQVDSSETIKEKANLVPSETEANVYHVEGVLTAENIAEINGFKNKTILILENTRGLTSEVLSQIDSDRVFFSVKGGLDYEKVEKYNNDNYRERTMMSPKGLERAINYFEKVESEIDPNWTDTQKCMYAYNCLAVDMTYGEDADSILSQGTAARGLNGILYGELVCAGFAFTFQEMMNRMGIECHYQNEKSTHAYNVVKLDGKYYGVDVTWDSYISSKDSEARAEAKEDARRKCGFQNFGRDEHFYEQPGHLNYIEEIEFSWDDDASGVKKIYDEAEERFDLSVFDDDQLRADYAVISKRIARRSNGFYKKFAGEPVENRETYLPVMDIRERKITNEANADSADFVIVLRELRSRGDLTLDQKLLDALQPRIGYVLDARDGGYGPGSISSFGGQELDRLRAIRSGMIRGEEVNENEQQTIIDSLNQQLETAVKAYISKTFENISESIESYEKPTSDMDETRRLEEANRRTKMGLVLSSRDYLIGAGYDAAQVDDICAQIKAKLGLEEQAHESTPEERKAKGIDFLSAAFSDKAQIRGDIEMVEGIKLTDEEFEKRSHDADYLLDKIYPGLDLNEYDVAREEFQEILDHGL